MGDTIHRGALRFCPCETRKGSTMAKKKGFMTPERKKKLRTLLRKKAAEELKKEQERKAEERLRVIAERCGTKAEIDASSMDDLKGICQKYFDKWYGLFILQYNEVARSVRPAASQLPTAGWSPDLSPPSHAGYVGKQTPSPVFYCILASTLVCTYVLHKVMFICCIFVLVPFVHIFIRKI